MPQAKPAFRSLPASVIPRIVSEGKEAEEFEKTIHHKICDRAYFLFEQSGRAAGKEKENWIRAESEVLRRGLQARESGTWVALTASIPDASADGIEILVNPKRVIVRVGAAGELYRATDLDVEVEPATAAASFKEQQLNLMVKKRRDAGTQVHSG